MAVSLYARRGALLGALSVPFVACLPRLSQPSTASPAAALQTAPIEDVAAQFGATGLTVPPCLLLDVRGGRGEPLQRCPGLGGYQLQLQRDTSPPSVSVLGPRGERWSLYLERVTQAPYAEIAESAVWRVQGARVVVALRLVSPAPGDRTERWVIARVTPERACVTRSLHLVNGGFEQLEPLMAVAHRLPCLAR